MASKQQRRKSIIHISPLPILRIAQRSVRTLFVPRKGLIKRRGREPVTLDRLPDDILVDIFDFCRIDSGYYPWRWHTLAHVCQRWRHILFALPRRLDLQFICTPRTRVRELLEFLPPAMPVIICNSFDPPPLCSTVSLEDGSQVIAALEQRDHVACIQLEEIPSFLLEKMAAMMHETFPTLKYVRLSAADDEADEVAPVLPDSFLGGSAPFLHTFWLRGVPFPEAPKLLLSAGGLVHLRLEKIPDSGYISPEALVTSLSACPKLETLVIEFMSEYPHPDMTNRQITSLARVSLHVLNCFSFEGNGGYFNNFFPRLDTPLLALEDITPHDISANRHVFYEVSFTLEGFSFRYWYNPLVVDPVLVEG